MRVYFINRGTLCVQVCMYTHAKRSFMHAKGSVVSVESEFGRLWKHSEWGSVIAQWQSARLVCVHVPAGVAGELSSPGSSFSADSYLTICSTPVLPQ